MPLHQQITSDPLSAAIQFRTSVVIEMLLSLQCLLKSHRHGEWNRLVESSLGTPFVKEVTTLYDRFHGGRDFTEIGVEAPDQDDVPGFIDFVRSLDDRTFTFYLLGRIYPLDEIPQQPTRQAVEELASRDRSLSDCVHIGTSFDWADNPSALKDQLTAIWSRYWNELFARHAHEQTACTQRSIAEKQEAIEHLGGTMVFEQVTGMKTLPEPIPADSHYETVVFVPTYFLPGVRQVYYGYGNVTVIYSCLHTEKRSQELEDEARKAQEVIRALSDPNRLKILRLVARDAYRYNGRSIAENLGLSTSVISRHLGQLRSAGLISEHSPDNRNVTYRLNPETVARLSETLLRYLEEQ